MSLNRYEQTIFNYWQSQPDELRHWQNKVVEVVRFTLSAGEPSRVLERELWEYFVERSQFVATFRDLSPGGIKRVSLLNLAEYVLRLWGPLSRKQSSRPSVGS